MALASTSKAQHVLVLPPSGSNMALFYGCTDLSDCVIVTERDGQARSCHKVVLSAASAVFRAMFKQICEQRHAGSKQWQGSDQGGRA